MANYWLCVHRSSTDLQPRNDRVRVYIGGIPEDVDVPQHHASSRDYTGCVRDLIVDGDRIGLSDESKDERRLEKHNVEDGCRVQALENCDGCEGEACIDYLMVGKPYCDCEVVGASCSTAGELSYICCVTYVIV